MVRERSADKIRRLREKGIFDVGTFYIKKRPFDRDPTESRDKEDNR